MSRTEVSPAGVAAAGTDACTTDTTEAGAGVKSAISDSTIGAAAATGTSGDGVSGAVLSAETCLSGGGGGGAPATCRPLGVPNSLLKKDHRLFFQPPGLTRCRPPSPLALARSCRLLIRPQPWPRCAGGPRRGSSASAT